MPLASSHNKSTPALSRSIVLFAAVLLLSACSEPTENIKLGFIGGISGRVADLGIAGRDGVILAVEQTNAKGGINGRAIELIIRDDKQNTDIAINHTNALLDQQVAAILGPMTSSIAMAISPITNRSGVVLMGISTTTNQLSGKDDYFCRPVGATVYHAGRSADYLTSIGQHKFNIAIDTNNAAYTRSWQQDFADALEEDSGQVLQVVEFSSKKDTDFTQIARQLLQGQPDGIAIAANSVDAALLATQIRNLNKDVTLVGSEWSATERLIELGGSAVDGMITAQYFDRDDQSPGYLEFRNQYINRFANEPGFASVLAYNAANIVISSLEQQREDENLKHTILRLKTFPGIQDEVKINPYCDSESRNFLTEIKNGRFSVIQ